MMERLLACMEVPLISHELGFACLPISSAELRLNYGILVCKMIDGDAQSANPEKGARLESQIGEIPTALGEYDGIVTTINWVIAGAIFLVSSHHMPAFLFSIAAATIMSLCDFLIFFPVHVSRILINAGRDRGILDRIDAILVSGKIRQAGLKFNIKHIYPYAIVSVVGQIAHGMYIPGGVYRFLPHYFIYIELAMLFISFCLIYRLTLLSGIFIGMFSESILARLSITFGLLLLSAIICPALTTLISNLLDDGLARLTSSLFNNTIRLPAEETIYWIFPILILAAIILIEKMMPAFISRRLLELSGAGLAE